MLLPRVHPTGPDESNNEIPSTSTLMPHRQSLSAGFGGLFSSLSWIETIFAYSQIIVDEKPSPILPFYIQRTVALDTMWSHPRLIGSLIIPELPGHSNADAIPLLKDGAIRFPDNPQFRIIWAQYILESISLDSNSRADSAAHVLFPLATSSSKVPEYARTLAFTLLHRSGRPEESMTLLLKTYESVPDPIMKLQFHKKIFELLKKSNISLGTDSANFSNAIGYLLDSKNASDRNQAQSLLVCMMDSTLKDRASQDARSLARQFESFKNSQ